MSVEPVVELTTTLLFRVTPPEKMGGPTTETRDLVPQYLYVLGDHIKLSSLKLSSTPSGFETKVYSQVASVAAKYLFRSPM